MIPEIQAFPKILSQSIGFPRFALGTGKLLICLCLLALGTLAPSQIANFCWPRFHGGITSSGLSLGANTLSAQKFATPIQVSPNPSSPITGPDGTVYVGGGSNLYAVNGSGLGIVWTFPTAGTVQASPFLGADGTIYVCSYSTSVPSANAVYAINSTSGQMKWSYQTLDQIYSSPTLSSDGKLFVATNSGHIYAFQASNGNVLWETTPHPPAPIAPESFVSSPALSTIDGTIYIGGLSDTLYAIKPADGSVNWTVTAGAGIASSPAIDQAGNIYFGCNDQGLYSVSSGGSLRWIFLTQKFITSSPAIGPDGTIYIGSQDQNLYAVDPQAGTKKWAFQTQAAISSSPAVAGDGTVYLGPDDGNIYAIDGTAGTQKWQFSTVGSSCSPALGVDGTLYFEAGSNLIALQSVYVVSISVNTSNVLGGKLVLGSVNLNKAAPAGGAFVELFSNNAAATVPQSLIVPQGQNFAQFVIQTNGVDSTVVANLTAYPGINQGTTLTVNPPSVQALTLQPSTIPELGNSVGTVVLNGPAGPHGAQISVGSSSSAVILPQQMSPPIMVVVPPGGSSTTFPLSSKTVDDTVVATITASYLSGSALATLTIKPATLIGLTVNPTSVAGGYASVGTVTLDLPAGPSGAAITLNSSNPVARVPSTVTVLPGLTTATFNIATTTVSSETTGQILGNLRGVPQFAVLTVDPIRLASISVDPTSIIGGNSVTGTVSLNAPAGPNGITVTLSCPSTLISFPRTVTVAAGQFSATFQVNTIAVSSQSPVVITAKQGGQAPTATLTILPASPSALSIAPSQILGGGTATGTITLNGVAGPNGIVVTLQSNSSSATVPASVKIPVGATVGTFAISTTGVNTSVNAIISAAGGITTPSATLTILATAVSSLSLNPTEVLGGNPCTGTVTLIGPASPSGTTVALSTNNGAASVPTSVKVLPGQLTASFPVTTPAVVSQSYSVITATLNGSANQSITIDPPKLIGISVNPASVAGASTTVGTVTLSGPATLGGLTVVLKSSNKLVTVPKSVVLTAGLTSAAFPVGTKPVSVTTPATISGSLGSAIASATLTLEPLGVVSLAVDPKEINGGATAIGTITLNGLAPTGGTSVRVLSNSSAALVPASVTVTAGYSSATFTIHTNGVPSQKLAALTAKLGTTEGQANLVIDPPILAGLSVSPNSVAGGLSTTGILTISGVAPPTGLPIQLVSSSASAIVPATVTVPGGKSTVSFVIKSKVVATTTSAQVSATLNGITKEASLTLTAPAILSLKLSPPTVAGGKSSTGTITLNVPAPAGGLTIKVASGNSAASVPTSVAIPPSKTTATFKITTIKVNSKLSVTISVSAGSSQQSATLTIT